MMDNLKIALCQVDTVWEDAKATITSLDGVASAFCERHNPDILVLPETFAVGFTMNHSVSEPVDGYSASWMKEFASRTGVALIGSIPTVEGEKRFNRCLFVTPDGTCFKYDKHHLFNYSGEGEAYDPGTKKCIVEYKGWKIALNVCYDLRFPVWSRNVNKEYDLLVNIANWPVARVDCADILIKARAIENCCYALFCNRTGKDAFCEYNGKSQVVNYFGQIISAVENFGDTDFFTAELSMDELEHYREKFPVWKDADKFDL